jgi:hypothetical protein
MTGLLYGIQGYFTATYSGRYLAHLLAELFRRSPNDFARILNAAGINYAHKRGNSVVANGWRFPTTPIRFADIAILNSAGNPLVLAEIKDADIKSASNSAQLDDYLKLLGQRRNEKLKFLFLSRTVPPEKDERKLQTSKHAKRVHQMLFGELYGPLRVGGDPFCQMLRDYLEDINVVYHDKKPDTKTMHYVTGRMLGMGGRKATEKSVPEFFDVVFGNLFSLGQWVQNNNPNLVKQGFRRRLHVEPWHDVQRLEKVMTAKGSKKASKLKTNEYLGDYCKGGEIDFYTCGYLTYKKAKVYLEFGYWSDLEKKPQKPNANRYSSGIYANLEWAPWTGSRNDLVEGSKELKTFPSEETFQKELRKFLKGTKAAALLRTNCPKGVKQVLRQFKVP